MRGGSGDHAAARAASLGDAVGADAYDGATAPAIAARAGVPRVSLFARVTSTMDVAHALGAAGDAAGTLVLAEAQSGGRGRAGRRWRSPSGAGLWLTLLERPADASALDVLSLRLGLHAAEAVQPFAEAPVRLKWPNDLYVGAGKLAGILVEARWRDAQPEWVAVGFGLNVRAPAEELHAAGLRPGVARLDVLAALVPALRAAAAVGGALSVAELARWGARDLAVGRAVRAPVAGTVVGITAAGAVRVRTPAGGERQVREGSLDFVDA